MKYLYPNEVKFSPTSIIDDAGKVFFYKGGVYRAIYSKSHADLYASILSKSWMEEIFDCGLVRTSISGEVMLNDSYITLEHEAIPFETHPAESTNYMHWLAAKALVNVNLSLSRHGLLLKDAHPWNVMFHKGYATVIDFGSIIGANTVPSHWHQEFARYFCVPLWIASTRWKRYAKEYRREHTSGFGIKLFENYWVKNTLLRSIKKIEKYLSSPVDFFSNLDTWLEHQKPENKNKEFWATYQQCGDSGNWKKKFVHDILQNEKPKKVIDLAANKGFYSKMAALLGSEVIAFDYEEYCVDQCLSLAQTEKLAITPAWMDFNWPTPSFGMGLSGRDAFERFRSEIVLALGLVHHICIKQRVPVEIFCEICMNYAEKGIILEYVDPLDKHVANWGLPIPENYSIKGMKEFFSRKFNRMVIKQDVSNDGLCRTMLYFDRN